MGKARSVEDIKDLETVLGDYWNSFIKQCEEEDTFYNLEFHVEVPKDFAAYTQIPPDARLAIDEATSHVPTNFLPIRVPARNQTERMQERAEALRKFYIGCWYRINHEQGLILHDIAKHGFLYGRMCAKVVFLSDYEEGTFPLVVLPVNPQNLLPDPGGKFVIERYTRKAIEVKEKYPEWGEELSIREYTKDVKWIEYWDDEYVIYLCDGKEVMASRKHGYGFNPYVFGDGGFGLVTKDSAPEKRYKGMLWPVHNAIETQARLRTQYEVILAASAWPKMEFSGEDDRLVLATMDKYDRSPGTDVHVPAGVTVKISDVPKPPDEVLALEALTTTSIDRVSPRTARGESVGEGSGYKVAVQAGLSRLIYDSVLRSLTIMTEEINKRLAMLVENVLQDEITVWAKTPAEVFDQVIGPKDIDGYYINYVTLMAQAPEDDDRLQRLGLALWQSKLLPRRYVYENYLRIPNPTEVDIQRWAEMAMDGEQMQQFLQSEALRITQHGDIEQAIQNSQKLMGMGLIPPQSSFTPLGTQGMTPQTGAATPYGIRPVRPGSQGELTGLGQQLGMAGGTRMR